MNQNPTHNVLQLHGGGALVLSEILKCAILEKTTGRRINDLFQTTIADSGGAIARLCMEKMSAEDLLQIFIDIIGNTFPGRGFYYTQTLSRQPRRFDNSVLRNQVKAILKDSKLADFKGNLFIGAHQNGEGAVTFEKFTGFDGRTHYGNASPSTPLSTIAKMTSTIPGVYSESIHEDLEYADGTYLDSLVNQNPSSILFKVSKNHPNTDIAFVQLGNIEDKDIAKSLLERSAMASRILNLHWKYMVHQLHSSHLSDVARVMGEDKAESFITYGNGRFSPADPSIDQLTRVVVETLADIERRKDDYSKLSMRLNNDEPLCMDVSLAIEDLKTLLDPMMKKRKVILGRNEAVPVEFPTPIILWAEDSKFYKPAYALGALTQQFAPNICRYLVASDFSVGGAFRIASESGLKKLSSSPPKPIEPK